MKSYSNKLKKLVDVWVDMALTKNLSGKGTQKQIMTFNLYQNIDLIRFSIVQQALLEGLVYDHSDRVLQDIDEQLKIVADIVYTIKGDIFKTPESNVC